MGRLIIVAGAGGAGKSFFLRCWTELDRNSVCIKKFVSKKRAPREIEIKTGESDLIFSRIYDPETEEGKEWMNNTYPNYSHNETKRLDYHDKRYDAADNNKYNVYNYQGAYYEVDVDSIDKALEEGKNPIVIIRKCETIKRIMERYSDALVIYVQSILSGEDLVQRLVALGESEQDARKRQGRNAEDLKDYVASIQALQNKVRVVVNDFDESESGAVFTQINDIYNCEISNYALKKNSIFIIQSYRNPRDVEKVLDVIKAAAVMVFATNENVFIANQRQDGAYLISDHVWDSIDKSDCIICDITNDRCRDCDKTDENVLRSSKQGISPNVLMELGYAISRIRQRGIPIEKRLIITERICGNDSRKRTQIPVDLGGTSLNVVYYENFKELAQQIDNYLKNMFTKKGQ